MEKRHVLSDVFASLMISFAIIVTMFHIVYKFMTPLYSAILIIAGLIVAIVFLFVGDEDRRRNMRIVSICCNSVAIGSIFGLLFMLLGMSLPIVGSIIVASIFAGLIFLMYLLYYVCDKRLIPGIILAIILISGLYGFIQLGFKGVEDPYSVYISLFFAIAIIHYIVALIVVTSDKKTIIDGMAYGYFGITLAILVVAGIFLLIASDGDVDLDIDIGGNGGKSSRSSSGGRNQLRGSASSKATGAKVSGGHNHVDIDLDTVEDIVYAGADLVDTVDLAINSTSPSPEYKYQRYMLYNAFYIGYLGSVLNNLTVNQIGELNILERQYLEGTISLNEYQKKLDKYK